MVLARGLAEACKAIVEHTNHTGWVMMQACHFRKRLGGCPVAIIAVCDAGGRFSKTERGTVEPRRDSWDGDIDGLGECVTGVDGKLSMRSGTARRCLVPPWDNDVALLENLAPFPGAQLQMIIPGRIAA